jgi:hypothetical protein
MWQTVQFIVLTNLPSAIYWSFKFLKSQNVKFDKILNTWVQRKDYNLYIYTNILQVKLIQVSARRLTSP